MVRWQVRFVWDLWSSDGAGGGSRFGGAYAGEAEVRSDTEKRDGEKGPVMRHDMRRDLAKGLEQWSNCKEWNWRGVRADLLGVCEG